MCLCISFTLVASVGILCFEECESKQTSPTNLKFEPELIVKAGSQSIPSITRYVIRLYLSVELIEVLTCVDCNDEVIVRQSVYAVPVQLASLVTRTLYPSCSSNEEQEPTFNN